MHEPVGGSLRRGSPSALKLSTARSLPAKCYRHRGVSLRGQCTQTPTRRARFGHICNDEEEDDVRCIRRSVEDEEAHYELERRRREGSRSRWRNLIDLSLLGVTFQRRAPRCARAICKCACAHCAMGGYCRGNCCQGNYCPRKLLSTDTTYCSRMLLSIEIRCYYCTKAITMYDILLLTHKTRHKSGTLS